MLLIANFMKAVGSLLYSVTYLFIFVLVARAILSWVNPDPRNPIVQFINLSTEPIIAPIRRKVPPLGMLDMSVLVAILLLYFIQQFLVASLMGYGELLARSATF